MKIKIMVKCREDKKRFDVDPNITLSELNDLVKGTGWSSLPQQFNLSRKDGDKLEPLNDGPLNLVQATVIIVSAAITLQYQDSKKDTLDVPLDIELQDLLKAIEDKLHCSDASVEEFDDDFEEWTSVQSSADLHISNKAKYKVEYEEVFCSTMRKLNQGSDNVEPQQAAKWMPENTQWKPLKTLTVLFLNKCGTYKGDEFEYGIEGARSNTIITDVQAAWSWQGKDCFKDGRGDPESDIRVKFEEGYGGSWSMIGSAAKSVDKNEPTMVIRWTKDMKYDDLRSIIVHQFGHALGLGHVLMKQSEWAILKDNKYVDTKKMMKSCGVADPDAFEVQWSGKGVPESDYVCGDDKSVMQFSTSILWLREKYRDKNKVQELESDHRNALFNFHDHLSMKNERLSDGDKKTLQKLYDPGSSTPVQPPVTASSPTSGRTVKETYQRESQPRINHLSFMRLDGERFRLLSLIAGNYQAIAAVLQLEQYKRDVIETFEFGNRITEVFKHWTQNAAGGYPVTWQGLYDILDDSELTAIANKFFDFLERHES